MMDCDKEKRPVVSMEGWLLKRGTQDHRRWCSLKGWSLTWKTSNDERAEVLGVLDLRDARFLTNPTLPLTFKIEGGVPHNASKAGKEYVLTSADEVEFRKWKKAVEAASELKHDEGVAFKGFLMKDSRSLLGGRGSEKRWFELSGYMLEYGESEGGPKLGRLDLRGARVICDASSLAFTLEGPILNVQKKGKSYYLTALTFEEMRSWTEQLKTACNSYSI
eukprot:Rhum_TRINITY_DN14388_c15_g4::Rhum_TRINITY_DN14388_c15_g4_i1::g.85959::m.85959